MRVALHASHADERREHEQVIERLKTEHKRLQGRIDAMYIDKLDGKIGGEFFDRMAGDGAKSRALPLRHRTPARGRAVLHGRGRPASRTGAERTRQFAKQEPREKRRLLNFLLSNCTWEGWRGGSDFPQPLIYWRKPPWVRCTLRQVRTRNRPKLRYGWGTRFEPRLAESESPRTCFAVCGPVLKGVAG